MKKGVLLISILLISMSFVIAQNTTNDSFEFSDEDLEIGDGGVTPDSFFYFLDSFFDRFGDDLEIREEKIAEIKTMIEQGNFEGARVALEKYRESADVLEKEVSPDEEEEARRSAEAIRRAVSELEDQIPEEDRGEFVNDVIESEERIVTSAQIASRIKELCEQLSEVDPNEYARVCKADDDAPEWQKELDDDLTEKQRAEAEKFGEIMSQCFRTSGQECSCEEIPFPEFAATCSKAAPLAVQCDIEGNENACEQLDNIEMPELPEHLQDVFDSLEDHVSEAQFELHMPRECREAGVTNPEDCKLVMIRTHAPEECRDALIEADVDGEREAREICEEIMFEQNAPHECIEEGIDNFRDCEEFMRSFEGEFDEGRDFGSNCRNIENPDERLRCYDSATGSARDYRDDFEERYQETLEKERQCVEECSRQGDGWSFSDGVCECIEHEEFEDDFGDDFEEFDETTTEEFEGPECSDNEDLVCDGDTADSCECVVRETEETTDGSTTDDGADSTSTNSETTEESSTTTDDSTDTTDSNTDSETTDGSTDSTSTTDSSSGTISS